MAFIDKKDIKYGAGFAIGFVLVGVALSILQRLVSK